MGSVKNKWSLFGEDEQGEPAVMSAATLAKMQALMAMLGTLHAGGSGITGVTVEEHPDGQGAITITTRQPGYVTLAPGVYECDTVGGAPPATGGYRLVGTSGPAGIPPSRGEGLPIYAVDAAAEENIQAAISLTGGVRTAP